MKTALHVIAHGLRVYAGLTKLWPLVILLIAWRLFGTPHLLVGEHLTSPPGEPLGYVCTYLGPWSEMRVQQRRPCDVIALFKDTPDD
ncbi:MAG: hypothetical protein AAF511_05605 [Pseudomonadota bacterium]